MALEQHSKHTMFTFFSRLKNSPLLAAEILLATFFISLLNLASPLFVIQLLNRYVGNGFDGTLITLTSGMLIAIFLQYGFRRVRTELIASTNQTADTKLASETLTALTTIRFGAIGLLFQKESTKLLTDVDKVQNGYEAGTLIPLLDAPFALLYILTIAFLSPLLALVVIIGLCLSGLSSYYFLGSNFSLNQEFSRQTGMHHDRELRALRGAETVRAFNARGLLETMRRVQLGLLGVLRRKRASKTEQNQSTSIAISTLQSVALYAVGAVIVVHGDLSIGALIGANILAARSMQTLTALFRTIQIHRLARESQTRIDKVKNIIRENEQGITCKQYQGTVLFHDLAFTYTGSKQPLFESLNLETGPGKIMVITGNNGAGKTTLIRMIAGLLATSRGDIRIDGINLLQLDMAWWRKQLMYMPQEPTFLDASIGENIFLQHKPDEKEISSLLRRADLHGFLDQSESGLALSMKDAGRLPLGIRKRIALARALATNGRLVLFDEPTEGVDSLGALAVYNLLNQFVKEGRTIILTSSDPDIIKAAHFHLDLNQKPVPSLRSIDL